MEKLNAFSSAAVTSIVIWYAIVCSVSGATYTDDNHGKGYLATPTSWGGLRTG